ncbi:MAG TPA: hypothetical protein VLA56_13375 [Pseudomonadales bacterium]|nr:hypothetical protein [Pseudomonadales bacterium]
MLSPDADEVREMMKFHDPRAAVGVEVEPYGLAIDLAGLNDCRVAFLANGFPDSVPFLQAVSDAMARLLPAMDARHWDKGNASIPAPDAMLDEIQADRQALVAAYGH